MSTEEKLARAESYKQEGNEFFKCQKFNKAKSSYGKALAFVQGLPGSSRTLTGFEALGLEKSKSLGNELEARASELEKVIHQNLATCFIKLNNPIKAGEHCDKALKIDPNAWKAILRKGEAFALLKKYDEAKILFENALKLCNDDAGGSNSILKELGKLEKIFKAYEAKERKMYSGLFRSSRDNAIKTEEDQNSIKSDTA
jgi:FK506-binding protein 4/5